jgi:hypothetical protein
MTLLMALTVSFVVLLPAWPHARGWGYGPSGGVSAALALVVVLLLTGVA